MKKEKEPTPLDLLKYEVAEELGLLGKAREGGWGALTTKESGRIGGIMARKLRENQTNGDT